MAGLTSILPNNDLYSQVTKKATPAAPASAAPPDNPYNLTSQQAADIAAHPEARSGAGHFGATSTDPSISTPPTDTTSTTTDATSMPPGLLSQSGAYEQWLAAHANTLNGPSNVDNQFQSGQDDILSHSPLDSMGPTNATQSYQDWLAQNGGGPSAGSSASLFASGGPQTGNSAGVLGGLATGPSNSTGVYGQAAGAMSGPGAYEQLYSQKGGSFNAPGAYENFYGKTSNGGVNDPLAMSDTENLYNSGMDHLNPFYDYAQRRAIEGAQNSSAARGGFNSGIAAQQESDIVGNLRGQQAQEQDRLAPEADSARMSRLGLASNEANTANSDYENRIKDMFGLAQDDQNAQENRFKNLSSIAQAGDSADTARANTQVNAAHNADQASIDAYSAQGQVGASADKAAIDAYNASQGAQQTGATLGLNQFNDNASLAQSQDAAHRANLDDLYSHAGQVDTSDLNRLKTEAGMASDEQSTAQGRLQQGFNDINQVGDQGAKLAQQVYADVSGINNMDDTQLQALADKYGVSLQEMKDVAGAGGQAASMLLSLVNGGGKK